jgi:hypothetical protein
MNKNTFKVIAITLIGAAVAIYLSCGGFIAAGMQCLIDQRRDPSDAGIALAGKILWPHRQIARCVGMWFYRFQQNQYDRIMWP